MTYRLIATAGVVSAATLAGSSTAQAQLFQTLLDGFVTPISQPSTPRVNGARVGQLRVVPNQLGQGYRLELDRAFGNDQFGRPEVFDAGPFELELQGNVQATASYTTRFFPIGTVEFNTTNLNYSLRGRTGAQDFDLVGTLNMDGRAEVNPLGFYEIQLDIQNTNSQLSARGLGIEGDEDTDFNVGPITVQGNILWDVGVGALAALGVDTSDLEAVFPRSPIEEIGDQIRAAYEGAFDGGVATAKELGTTRDLDLAAAYPDADVIADLVADIALSQLTSSFLEGAAGGGVAVPEPSTFGLLVISGLAMLRRR